MPEIDLPTVIFALVALFVAWKLRSVLGMRQDSERPGELMAPLRRAPGPASAPVAQPDAAPSAPVSQAPADRWKGVAEANPGVWSGLDAIASADRSFSPEAFLSGARVAYDMVVHAFAAGDALTSTGVNFGSPTFSSSLSPWPSTVGTICRNSSSSRPEESCSGICRTKSRSDLGAARGSAPWGGARIRGARSARRASARRARRGAARARRCRRCARPCTRGRTRCAAPQQVRG